MGYCRHQGRIYLRDRFRTRNEDAPGELELVERTALTRFQELTIAGTGSTSDDIRSDRTWLQEDKLHHQIVSVTATELVAIINNGYLPESNDEWGIVYKPIQKPKYINKRNNFTVVQAVMLAKAAQLAQANDNVLGDTRLADKIASFLTPTGLVSRGSAERHDARVAELKRGGIPYADFSNELVRCTDLVIAWQLEKLLARPQRSDNETHTRLWAISNAAHYTATRYTKYVKATAPIRRLLSLAINRAVARDIYAGNFTNFSLETFSKVHA